ncbi:MAG: ChaB family protein [Candidatus Nucleicultricaceae bacterium]
MPYTSINDLPKAVRDHLPKKAQEIYMASFNQAFEFYKKPGRRKVKSDIQEQVAARVAWSAVKKQYHKANDHWVVNRSEKTQKHKHA